MAKYLVDKGAVLNATDNTGKTPLDAATSKEVREYLTEIGAKRGSEL